MIMECDSDFNRPGTIIVVWPGSLVQVGPFAMSTILGFLTNLKKKTKKEPGHLGHLDQSNQPAESLDKTQFLHAFRTITLMLSLIHSKRITKRKIQSTPELKKELKPLDALAAIAIRQHGIAAATIAMRNDTLGTLQVLASSDSPSTGSGPTIPQTSSPTSKIHEWFKLIFLLALNPRNDRAINHGQEASGQSPKIVDPDTEIPENLKFCEESDLLKTYLTDVWWAFTNIFITCISYHVLGPLVTKDLTSHSTPTCG
jgi:hypothetical protein